MRKKTSTDRALSRNAPKRKAVAESSIALDGTRRVLGRERTDGAALFPAPQPMSELPRGYAETLRQLKARIQQTRLRAVLAANAAMIQRYWDLGHTILDRQAREGWGTKVIDRFSHDLREEFPDMAGLSPRNLLFMRSFAQAYPDSAIMKRLVSQLSRAVY